MNNYIKEFCVLSIIFLTKFCPGQSQEFLTPKSDYKVEYSVDVFGPQSGVKIGGGSFSLSEVHGSFLLDYHLGDEHTTLEYENGRSLLIRQPTSGSSEWFESHPALYSDGLEYLSTGLPLYLPFQLRSVAVYSPLADFRKVLERAKGTVSPEVYQTFSDLGPSNVSIRGRSGPSEDGLVPGYFRTSLNSMMLTAGTPSQKAYDYVYSDFRDMFGVKIPYRIEMLAYLSLYSRELRHSLEPQVIKRYVFKVKAIKAVPDTLQKFKKESLLAKGMWVNYNSHDGKGASVIFDPAKGTLDQQLGLQLALKRSTTAMVNRRSELPVVSIVFAIVLGVGSILCLIGSRKRPN